MHTPNPDNTKPDSSLYMSITITSVNTYFSKQISTYADRTADHLITIDLWLTKASCVQSAMICSYSKLCTTCRFFAALSFICGTSADQNTHKYNINVVA